MKKQCAAVRQQTAASQPHVKKSEHGKGRKMTDLEEMLVHKANEKHTQIYPCPPRNDFEQCFTREKNRLFFWYNTEDQSTHVLTADLRN
jgi:hypothetical protein